MDEQSLKDALADLLMACLVYESSDPEMPSHKRDEQEYEDAKKFAAKVLARYGIKVNLDE